MDIEPNVLQSLIGEAVSNHLALRFLDKVQSPACVPVLLEAVDSADDAVRAAALHALALIGDERGAARALDLLPSEGDDNVAGSAIIAISDCPDGEASNKIAEQLGHPKRRFMAALALAWRQDDRGLDVLIEHLAQDTIFRSLFRDPAIALAWLQDRRGVPVLHDVLRRELAKWSGAQLR